MKCNVAKDLMPLYIDECCSEESAKAVKDHLANCHACAKIYEEMKTQTKTPQNTVSIKKFSKINEWKASILQSVLLFISFAVITAGVALEASTPVGLMNGFWAFSLVIPATGFMLSLANWYFVRLYKSRKSFSVCSLTATLAATLCACIWAVFHYEIDLAELIANRGASELLEIAYAVFSLYGIGILLVTVFSIMSKTLSSKYAEMLGKE